jgi:hypothetical protein
LDGQDDGSAANGRLVFRLKPLAPLSERRMFMKKLVSIRKQSTHTMLCAQTACTHTRGVYQIMIGMTAREGMSLKFF